MSGDACLYSCGIQLFGNFVNIFYHSRQTEPAHPRKHFLHCSRSSNSYCNEYKLLIHWIAHLKSLWYQQFDLSEKSKLRSGRSIVVFDAVDNCCLYVTTLKATNIQECIPSFPIANFEDHYVLMFDLTSMQDAIENCHYRDLIGEPVRL